MSEERPLIIMPEWRVLFCAKHDKPLKEAWPAGCAIATIGIFNAFQQDARAFDMMVGDIRNAPACMKRVKPVCCWLSKGVAEQVVQLALDGKPYPLIDPATGKPVDPKDRPA
jgi:hypothetical protein